METITVEVLLYGSLAERSAGKGSYGYASLHLDLKQLSTIGDLLTHLDIPTLERGITFINGKLSAMPGMQPDLEHVLSDGDRVALFDLRSMWPFQYRSGAVMTDELASILSSDANTSLHHSYQNP